MDTYAGSVTEPLLSNICLRQGECQDAGSSRPQPKTNNNIPNTTMPRVANRICLCPFANPTFPGSLPTRDRARPAPTTVTAVYRPGKTTPCTTVDDDPGLRTTPPQAGQTPPPCLHMPDDRSGKSFLASLRIMNPLLRNLVQRAISLTIIASLAQWHAG